MANKRIGKRADRIIDEASAIKEEVKVKKRRARIFGDPIIEIIE